MSDKGWEVVRGDRMRKTVLQHCAVSHTPFVCVLQHPQVHMEQEELMKAVFPTDAHSLRWSPTYHQAWAVPGTYPSSYNLCWDNSLSS